MKSVLELSIAGTVFHNYKNSPYVSDQYMWAPEYYPVYHPYKVVKLIRKGTDRWEAIELAPSYVCDHEYTECYE
jgi:hypothetical protein